MTNILLILPVNLYKIHNNIDFDTIIKSILLNIQSTLLITITISKTHTASSINEVLRDYLKKYKCLIQYINYNKYATFLQSLIQHHK